MIILLGRNISTPVIEAIHALNASITIKYIHMDLASLASVRKASDEINGDEDIKKSIMLLAMLCHGRPQNTTAGVLNNFGSRSGSFH
jgi:hypothetical protein